jgi:hypothetical protein
MDGKLIAPRRKLKTAFFAQHQLDDLSRESPWRM